MDSKQILKIMLDMRSDILNVSGNYKTVKRGVLSPETVYGIVDQKRKGSLEASIEILVDEFQRRVSQAAQKEKQKSTKKGGG